MSTAVLGQAVACAESPRRNCDDILDTTKSEGGVESARAVTLRADLPLLACREHAPVDS
ncbi:hypothetical protein M2280_005597 [Prescottella agglutinans]|uniref:Uncharacterized protein n=1 Tax=Prescottella agglutinans TaxID=1644129 RepID=A0ABT6MKC9_9NOCA|nr:hypothetical protein [Prescottella agglutinans]